MPGVFLNYRVGDGEAYAGWIDERLSNRIGAHNVFRASRSIPAGAAFDDWILAALSQCDVVVAVIGPKWLTPRIRDEDDWVRRELAQAIRLGIPIIPVLFDGAARLAEADLPAGLEPMARFQYLRMHYRSAHTELPRLVEAVFECAPALAAEEITYQLIIHIGFDDGSEQVHRAIRDAFTASGVSPSQFRIEDRDRAGLLVLLPAEVAKARVLGAWITDLARELKNGPGIRVGVHSGHTDRDVELAQTLGSSGLARRLAAAARDAPVVVVVSDRIHQTVVSRGGRGVEPDSYRKVTVAPDIAAWVRVPGWTVPPAVPDDPEPVAAEAKASEPAGRTVINNNGSGVAIGTYHGRDLNVGMVHNHTEGTR